MFPARWRFIPARGHVPLVPASHQLDEVELRTGAVLVELLDELARALHAGEGARTQLGHDRAVALRVLLTGVQARNVLRFLQPLVPVKRVEESGEVIVQGLRSAEQRIAVRDRATSVRPVWRAESG